MNFYKLIGKHIRDWHSFEDAESMDFYGVDPVGDYSYSNDTGRIEETPGTGDHSLINRDIKHYDRTNVENVEDVEAFFKTKYFVTQRPRLATRRMLLKRDIRKMVNKNSEEIASDIYIYNDASNIAVDLKSITHYKDSNEINDNVDIARINGTRNYIQTEIGIPGQQGRGTAFKLTAKNDCRIYDFYLDIAGRKDEGE